MQRRQFMMSAAGAAGLTALGLGRGGRVARAEPSATDKFLFVVAATGGASIIDSFLPIAASEAGEHASTLVTYPDSLIVQPPGSNLRCVGSLDLQTPFVSSASMEGFLAKYYEDMLVMTVENTSVNHAVAQKRAITGSNVDRGRTIMEAMAATYGANKVLPNCNMATGGYLEPGIDSTLPSAALAEVIADPSFFALSSHGTRGVAGAPQEALIARARAARAALEERSSLNDKHSGSVVRERILQLRDTLQPEMENGDLITKLMLLQSGENLDLESYGLESSPELGRLLDVLPNLAQDPAEAQAALAFLLARYGIASSITMGLSFIPTFTETQILGTPLAFDFSHNSHIDAQNVSWRRILGAVDGLIALLKSEPLGDGTMWDRSLIYVATDFGRSKERPADAVTFGSGHHLNNGSLFISPLLKGNRVLGGVDPTTALTYGIDFATGEPDPNQVMREEELYSLICNAMDIEFTGRRDFSYMLR